MSDQSGATDVDLWLADVEGFWAAHASALRGLLSDDERERAAGFRFERDRERFAARRALLRVVLGRACGREPCRLRFAYGPHGKPRVEGEPSLEFSGSHSAGLAAFAVARGAEVGVDVEQVRAEVEVDALARRFFAPAEVDALAALPETQRRRAFFAYWTAKEAFVKAVGRGLWYPLDAFVVSFGERSAIAVDGDPAESARWTLHTFDPGPGYAGAVVVADGRPLPAPRTLDPPLAFG